MKRLKTMDLIGLVLVGWLASMIYLGVFYPGSFSLDTLFSYSGVSGCERLKVDALEMLNEKKEGLAAELRGEALKIYDDVEDLTKKLEDVESKMTPQRKDLVGLSTLAGTASVTHNELEAFRLTNSIDDDARILFLCKGKVKFSRGPDRYIHLYAYEDVDGDTFMGVRIF